MEEKNTGVEEKLQNRRTTPAWAKTTPAWAKQNSSIGEEHSA